MRAVCVRGRHPSDLNKNSRLQENYSSWGGGNTSAGLCAKNAGGAYARGGGGGGGGGGEGIFAGHYGLPYYNTQNSYLAFYRPKCG